MFVLNRLADPQVAEVCNSPEGTARSCRWASTPPMSPYQTEKEKTRSPATLPLTTIARVSSLRRPGWSPSLVWGSGLEHLSQNGLSQNGYSLSLSLSRNSLLCSLVRKEQ